MRLEMPGFLGFPECSKVKLKVKCVQAYLFLKNSAFFQPSVLKRTPFLYISIKINSIYFLYNTDLHLN
jgi:hypothetical protein